MSDALETDREINPGRIALGVAGVLALVAAFSGLLGEHLVAAVATALGSDYLLAAGLGGIALVLATSAFASGIGTARQATMPEVERPTPVSAPGEAFDRKLSGWRGRIPIVGPTVREDVRRRLRRAAVRVIVADTGCSREEAERRVTEGTWTDDSVVAAFLDPTADRPPLAVRIAALRRRESWLQYVTRRTVDALADRHVTGRQR